MKKALIAVAVLVLGSVLFLFFGLNPALKRFQPEITAALSTVTKRPVTFDSAGISIFPTTGITLMDLSIGKGTDGGVSIERVVLKASLLKILQGSVSVSEILVQGVDATITKRANGAVAISEKAEGAATEPVNTSEAETESSKSSFALRLDSVKLSDLSFTLRDESVSPAKITKAEKLNLSLEGDLSAEKLAVLFDFDATSGSISVPGAIEKRAGTPLTAKGSLKRDGDRFVSEGLLVSIGNASIPIAVELTSIANLQGKLGINAATLSLEEIAKSFGQTPPALNGAILQGLELSATGDGISESGALSLKLTSLVNSILPVGNVSLKTSANRSQFQLLPSEISLLGGVFNLQGTQILTAGQEGSWKITGSGGELEKVPGNTFILGTLTKLAVDTRYRLPNPKETASGALSLGISKGELTGVNLLADVLRGIKGIPGVEGALLSSAPPSAQAVLNAKGTAFDTLNAELTFDAPQVAIRSIVLSHPLYSLTGSGSASFAADAQLSVQFKLSPLLVSGMIAKEKGLTYLTDQNGNIEIPVVIRKSGSSVVVLPDAERLIKNAARSGATKAAEKALDKVAPGLGGAAKVFDSLF